MPSIRAERVWSVSRLWHEPPVSAAPSALPGIAVLKSLAHGPGNAVRREES
jgi:hypothetical protein